MNPRGENKLEKFYNDGVRIDPLTMAETVVKQKNLYEIKTTPFDGVNADKLNQCATDEAIKKIVNESEIINADGASVVLAALFGLCCPRARGRY